jgi:hypothetical protein
MRMRQQMKMLPLSRLESRHVTNPTEDSKPRADVHAPHREQQTVHYCNVFFRIQRPGMVGCHTGIMRLSDPDLCVARQ